MPLFKTRWSEVVRGLHLFGLEDQSDYLLISKTPFCNKEKYTQKRKVISQSYMNGVQAGPGEHKDLFSRHTIYVFCVFLKNNLKLAEKL